MSSSGEAASEGPGTRKTNLLKCPPKAMAEARKCHEGFSKLSLFSFNQQGSRGRIATHRHREEGGAGGEQHQRSCPCGSGPEQTNKTQPRGG